MLIEEIDHPLYGKMYCKTRAAKYLGISRKRFERIAPKPDVMRDGFQPFWAKRVLDTLPTDDDFDHDLVFKKGRACGEYLIATMTEEQIRTLCSELCWPAYEASGQLSKLAATLNNYGVRYKASGDREAKVFRDGIANAINSNIRKPFDSGGRERSTVDKPSKDSSSADKLTWSVLHGSICDEPRRFEKGDWLAYWEGLLVGRLTALGEEGWIAGLEGELPHEEVGRFTSLTEGREALAEAVRKAMQEG